MIIADGKLTIVGANAGATPYTITVSPSGVATLGPTYFTDLNVTGTLTTTAATIDSLTVDALAIESATVQNLIVTENLDVNNLTVSELITAQNAEIEAATIQMLNTPDNSARMQFNHLAISNLDILQTSQLSHATIGNATITNAQVSYIAGNTLAFDGSADIRCEIDVYDWYLLILENKSKYGALEVLTTVEEYPETTSWTTLLSHANLMPDLRDAYKGRLAPTDYRYDPVTYWTIDAATSYKIPKCLMVYTDTLTPIPPVYVWIAFKATADGPVLSKKCFSYNELHEKGSIIFTLSGGAATIDDNAITVDADIFSEYIAIIKEESANSTAALREWVGGTGTQYTMQTMTYRGMADAHFNEQDEIWYSGTGDTRTVALPGFYFKNANT